MEVSPDHRYVALLVDTSGYEEFTLRVLEVATGTWLPDALDTLGFGLAWASDSRTVFYLTTDAAKRANEVFQMLDGKQRTQSLVELAPHESAVGFRPKGDIQGLPLSDLSADPVERVAGMLHPTGVAEWGITMVTPPVCV